MKSEEHAFKTFQRTLKSGVLPSVMLLFGPEDYLTSWAVKELIAQLVNPATAAMDHLRFSENEMNASDIIAACETLPMLSERKLVVVENCDAFSGSRSLQLSTEDQQAMTDYIKKIPQDTLLLFTADKVDKRKALYKAIIKTGIAYEFTPVSEETLKAFLSKRISAAGKKASSPDISRFIRSTGYGDKDSCYTLYNIENDLKKVFALSDGNELMAADFEAAVTGNAETDAFALLDAAFSGKKGVAFTLLRNNIAGELPSYVDGVIFRMIGLICSQLEIMLVAKERRSEGQSMQELPKAMGVNAFRLQKAMEAASGRSVAQLAASLDAAYQLERDIKSGAMPSLLALELFIAML